MRPGPQIGCLLGKEPETGPTVREAAASPETYLRLGRKVRTLTTPSQCVNRGFPGSTPAALS